ncbi:tryptophan-rich sensory protein [Mucilaginibacter sp. RS28]|uniref:Tryptophan-rich sensory protein n=1 Tax=Mucilaginibacter straminoryzae TaxID=2932774 RepID=A0A9X2BD97_9SPHI|nr:TspO/MBR family protein [Mucilaginibacter straminoryzae]MCJ8210063.1 tryptophan-rich sensory protein [Mucilaginibacter straminoryzae]
MSSPKNKIQILPLVLNLLIPLAIGFVASLYTRPEIPGWYRQLHKPSFTPPSWLFAPVWTSLYILMGIAAYMVWKNRNNPAFKKAAWVYIAQLVFNFSWSIIFFGNHEILGALTIIVTLWVLILLNIITFAKISKTAAWLLVPYLLWVSYATALNTAIYLLNK